MATATITTKAVEKVVVDHEEIVRLELSRDEAETLRIIFGRIGGSPQGRRGHVTAMTEALEDAGVESLGQEDIIGNSMSGTHRGAIYFDAEVTR